MSFKVDRTASELTHLAGAFIAENANRDTLITPTRAELGSDLKNATVLVTVYPYEKTPQALAFLNRNLREFRQFLKDKGHLTVLPNVSFVEDEGEKNRQRLDELFRGT
ncbi:MAG: ribosome-binding factor A [bacterium]